MNTMKNTFARIWWLGRGTATAMGLAVLITVVFGVGTAALAAVPGDPFKLGRINTIGKVTGFAGSADDALLRIDNDSKGEGATALDLRVNPTKPPMKINSFAQVEKLNADLLDGRESNQFVTITDKASDSDKLDGKDSTSFFSGKTYEVRRDEAGPGGGQQKFMSISCDAGDKALGGGGGVQPGIFEDGAGALIFSRPGINDRDWQVNAQDDGSPNTVPVEAVCADFPPLR